VIPCNLPDLWYNNQAKEEAMAYRNVGDTLPVVQISADDVARSSTMDETDIGTWCFIMNGCLMGFFGSEEACRDRVNQLMTD